eukprot:TRINITY_DN15510_c0_g1_i15.p1 TRINITY_DN15510_c0_g1~~TRINITY_DN15510_c0_g1_i15.p1  ORF type:complete len:302 (+),score=66.24 TRINITY_DN15510_c0_g1_i15:915-1820(+)
MALPSAFSVLQLLLLTIYDSDSPQHYAAGGMNEEALRALRRIYVKEDEAEKRLRAITEYAQECKEVSENLYEKYKRAFWVGLSLPAIMELTGITAMASYAPIIYEEQPNSSYLPTLLSLSQFIFGILVLPIIDKFGRRTFFLLGAVVCSLAHLMCFASLDMSGKSTARNWIFNCGTFIYMGGFNISYGPMTYFLIVMFDRWLYMAEILPASWMGYGLTSEWIAAISLATISPFMFNYLNRWTFFLYFCLTAASGAFFWKFIVETKGKTVKEVRDAFETSSVSQSVTNIIPLNVLKTSYSAS